MKPYKNFLFVLFILLILALISLLWGGRSFHLTKKTVFRIPDFSFVSAHTNHQQAQTSKQPLFSEEDIAAFLAVDSSALNYSELQDVPFFPLDIPDKALDVFFQKLEKMSDTTPLTRILHYGDSQIEGDRITSSIRHYMQSTFGGSGMGLLPITSPVLVSSYLLDIPKEWTRHSIVDPDKKSNFSLTMGYLSTSENTYIKFRKSPYILYPTAEAFSSVNIISSSDLNPHTISAELKDVSEKVYFDRQQLGRFYAKTRIPVDTSVRQAVLYFETDENPSMIYGVSLDADYGLSVDNIPLRGSAGYIFTRNKADFLQEGLKFMNTGLILFQFGVNVMPNTDEVMTYDKAFEEALVKQLSFLKSIVPDIPVIVIGVSDRTIKRGDRFITNPNVALVIEAQRNAAMRTGCAFWDLFQAMGGENSMLDWVNQKPALATRDYIHFTAKGAQRVGEMFYKSLMIAYLEYCYKQKEKALEDKISEWHEGV